MFCFPTFFEIIIGLDMEVLRQSYFRGRLTAYERKKPNCLKGLLMRIDKSVQNALQLFKKTFCNGLWKQQDCYDRVNSFTYQRFMNRPTLLNSINFCMNNAAKYISWSCLSAMYTGDLTFIPFSESVDCVSCDNTPSECVDSFSAQAERRQKKSWVGEQTSEQQISFSSFHGQFTHGNSPPMRRFRLIHGQFHSYAWDAVSGVDQDSRWRNRCRAWCWFFSLTLLVTNRIY